jgi:hypothetical protein
VWSKKKEKNEREAGMHELWVPKLTPVSLHSFLHLRSLHASDKRNASHEWTSNGRMASAMKVRKLSKKLLP